MSRYIDADKIIYHLEDEIGCPVDIDTHPVEYGTYLGLLYAKSLVKTAETADVQEVRHGHWIEKDLDNFRKVESMIVMLIYATLNSVQIAARKWTRRSKISNRLYGVGTVAIRRKRKK